LSRAGFVALLAGAFAASACAATTPVTQPGPPALEGTRWVMAGAKSDAESTPRLEFSREGRVSGNTGCNRLSGSYRLEEDRLEVVAATTKRACLGAGGDAEQKLLAVLGDRPRVSMDGRRLVLTGKSGARFVLESAP
jgi:heat shock protein HslJ